MFTCYGHIIHHETKECAHCGCTHRVEEDGQISTSPCQGSDECRERLCESDDCGVKCYCCGLRSCAEHVQRIDGEPWCEVCRKQADDCAEEAKQIPARKVGGVR